MNVANFNVIYDKFRDRIYELFGILTAKELFQILDEDNDGFMNEDEQVLFFSIIKTKMLRCAQELLVIFDYKRFYDLMKCVRYGGVSLGSWRRISTRIRTRFARTYTTTS
jgi:hypothetical protein